MQSLTYSLGEGSRKLGSFSPTSDQWVFNIERPVVEIKEEVVIGSDLEGVKKSHEREGIDLKDVRSRKQSTTSVEDGGEVTDMFDKVLLLDGECDPQTLSENKIQESNKKKKNTKNKTRKKRDKTTALDLLLQRLAHCFTNALEAPLQGSTGPVIQTYYNAITLLKETASSPFVTLMYFFSFRMIFDAAKDGEVLHIVDFVAMMLIGLELLLINEKLSSLDGSVSKNVSLGISFETIGESVTFGDAHFVAVQSSPGIGHLPIVTGARNVSVKICNQHQFFILNFSHRFNSCKDHSHCNFQDASKAESHWFWKPFVAMHRAL
ncbi:hypothetical protein Bca4012_065400 [Brassica carinata]|uniref:Uncharacterized protein n=1 Tax=Brassica carinata TaxID=52824 RepID=A0A8X7VP80_BRACI|nr:hypothetical protein Bca52824_017745 [Brassica carinata]